jgi:hypothetical protein
MSKPSCFATPLLDWLKFHCWGDVSNYKKRYKYKCLNDSRYYGERLWAWNLILEGMNGLAENIRGLFGTHKKSFQNLHKMLLSIKDSNPRKSSI